MQTNLFHLKHKKIQQHTCYNGTNLFKALHWILNPTAGGPYQPVAVESGVHTPEEEPAWPQVLQPEFKDEICQQHQRPHHHKLHKGVRAERTHAAKPTLILIIFRNNSQIHRVIWVKWGGGGTIDSNKEMMHLQAPNLHRWPEIRAKPLIKQLHLLKKSHPRLKAEQRTVRNSPLHHFIRQTQAKQKAVASSFVLLILRLPSHHPFFVW